MSRSTVAVDRVMAFVVGLALIAVGAAGALWWRGTFASWPTRLDVGTLLGLTEQTWWPWATGVVGLILVLLALRWLIGHLPGRGVSQLELPGSGRTGRLSVHVRPIVKAAAEALEQTPGIRSASATIKQERGQLMAQLNATIEPRADLHDIAAAADRVSADLARVLQLADLRCQVNLTVAHHGRNLSRVT